ncbi:uncharacterized protein EDB91DRAFT_1234089 [Suillus paluster]|uniref:uncharacterized protein n=1 Tax=Suillus paluster TaxID=48578 RepID=UPI001B87AED9|nr:uncharacterized protein EDB91DRAFT_1234089 [Suillus paluster]KAG1753651.1 hypothetical protein EDB91DRAFT_1234089 [Suillus paluster]
MSNFNGLPLLSGALPSPATNRTPNACRKCNKEFIPFFTRATRCNHCDYQALMPRHGTASGYDLVHVCAFCIELLNITASSKYQLKTLPLSKLRRYVDAYNIPVKGPIDKNDLVDSIIAAKTPSGTLPPHHSARPRGFFSTRPPPPTERQTSTSPPDFPPSYTTRHQTPPARPPSPPPPPPPQPPRFRTASQPQTPPRPAPPSTPRPSPASNASPSHARSSTSPRSAPQPSTPPTPQPPPPLSALLAMSPSSLSPRKGELVARERAAAEERDRIEREEREQEEWERRDRERAAETEAEAEDAHVHGPEDPAENHHHSPSSSSPQPSSPPRTTYTERSGLCVICQDQEANIAIVDCGHLAMCRTCSELVLASSRECPLCRTRIVTEARLLRIFKT